MEYKKKKHDVLNLILGTACARVLFWFVLSLAHSSLFIINIINLKKKLVYSNITPNTSDLIEKQPTSIANTNLCGGEGH